MERNNHFEGGYTDHTPRQTELDDQHFAHVYAFSLLAHQIILDEDLKNQWIKEGFLSAYEIDLIQQAYEEMLK